MTTSDLRRAAVWFLTGGRYTRIISGELYDHRFGPLPDSRVEILVAPRYDLVAATLRAEVFMSYDEAAFYLMLRRTADRMLDYGYLWW